MTGRLKSPDLVVATVTSLLGAAMIGGVELNSRIMGILIVATAALQGFCAIRTRQKVQRCVADLDIIATGIANVGTPKDSNRAASAACIASTDLSRDLDEVVFVPDSPKGVIVVAASCRQDPSIKQIVPQPDSNDQKPKGNPKVWEPEKLQPAVTAQAHIGKKQPQIWDHKLQQFVQPEQKTTLQQDVAIQAILEASQIDTAVPRKKSSPSGSAQHNILAHFQRLTSENSVLENSLKNSQEDAARLRAAAHVQSLRLFRMSARLARLRTRRLNNGSRSSASIASHKLNSTTFSDGSTNTDPAKTEVEPKLDGSTRTTTAKPEEECLTRNDEIHMNVPKLLSVSEMQQVLKAESEAGAEDTDEKRVTVEQNILTKFSKMAEEKRCLEEEVSELRVLANQNATALMRQRTPNKTSRGSPTRSVCSFSTQTDVSSLMISSQPTTRDSSFTAKDSPVVVPSNNCESSAAVAAKDSNSSAPIKNILARFSALEAELAELRPRAELVAGLEAERDVLGVEVAGLVDQLDARNQERDKLFKKVSNLHSQLESLRRTQGKEEQETLSQKVIDLQSQLESLRRLQGKEWHQLDSVRKVLAPLKGPMFQIKWPRSSNNDQQSPTLAALKRDMEAGGGSKLSISDAPSDWRLRLQAALFSAGDPVVLSLTCKPNPDELDPPDAKMFGGFLWPAKEKDA